MGITWKHLWGHKVTMQYPDKFDPIKSGFIPEFARNRLYVDMDTMYWTVQFALKNVPLIASILILSKHQRKTQKPSFQVAREYLYGLLNLILTLLDVCFAIFALKIALKTASG